MLRWSSEALTKYVMTGVLFGALVLLAGVGWLAYMVGSGSVVQDIAREVPQPATFIYNEPETIIAVDEIDGVKRVNASIAKRGIPEATAMNSSRVQAAVLPQHALVAQTLADYWADLAETTNPEVIYIVGPAHWNQGNGKLQTMRGMFRTKFGDVETDNVAVSSLTDKHIATHEPESFRREHAIGVHVPYIAAYLPDAKIVPVLGKSYTGDTEARTLVEEIIDTENSLLVSSLDFSHYERSEEARDRDVETIEYFNRGDTDRIDTLSSAYLDSPFAANTFLRFGQARACQNDLVWHNDSGRMFQQEARATTSYMIWYCSDQQSEQEITVNAVGDVMLSRGVGEVLARKDRSDELAPIANVLSTSDATFLNLESVVSDVAGGCEKTYCFKADPETAMPVLEQIGTTHASVTNNHNADFGFAAWEDSVARLKQAGVTPVGGYRNEGGLVSTEHAGQTFAWLGFDTTRFPLALVDLKEAVREARASSDHVVVSFHWGVEYQHRPSDTQRRLARASIDAGADVVLGHHPHVLQGIERYKTGVIAYSLGNFVFDQFGADRNESVIMRIGFGDNGNTLELIPVRIDDFLPRPADADERSETITGITGWSGEAIQKDLQDGFIEWGRIDE